MRRTILALLGTLLLVVSLTAQKCEPDPIVVLPEIDNSFVVQQDGEDVVYDETNVSVTLDAAGNIVVVGSGYRDPIPNAVDDERTQALRVVLHRPGLETLELGKEYPIAAVGSWDLPDGQFWVAPENVTFTPLGSHIAAVAHLLFYQSCFCSGVAQGEQQWQGTILFTKIDDTHITGQLTATMIGNIPLAGIGSHTVTVTLGFDSAL